jgi:23S rRNA pseudouridine1911/1915/1917 synthase
MATLRFTVAETDAGVRLDKLLAGRDEIGSRALSEKLLLERAVHVDGQLRPKSHRVEPGSVVEVELPKREPSLAPEPATVDVRYEDEHLSLDAAGGPDPARPGIVHRLDRDTSGLLVVARSEEAYAALVESIRRRELDRRYLALVRGHPQSRTGRIDAPIGRDRRDPTKRSLDTEEPREAVTLFEILESLPEHTLLEVRLETGRTHQIRVHLAAIELPVAGDVQYGVAGDLGLRRQFLHAYRLRFRHPVTGEDVDVALPLPEDLEEALATART